MRRVQSSINGVCAGAGPTVVLQPASPAADGSRFGRQRRSSLVFTPCPPDTPTRSNSMFKIQRAASSFCSVTGWDFAPAVAGDMDDVVALDNFKATQQFAFGPASASRDSTKEIENQRSWGSEEAGPADDCNSCFVANSAARGGARSCAELASAFPSPSPSPSAYRSKSCVGAYDLPFLYGGAAQAAGGDWLGAELARQAPAPPLWPLPPPPSSCGGASWQQLLGGFGAVAAAGCASPGAPSCGEPRTLCGLRRTQRVWQCMDMLAE